LIKQLCLWDPSRRPTAEKALQHPFFHVGLWVPRPLHDPLELKLNNMGAMPNLELNLWDFNTDHDDCFLGLTLAVKPSVSNLDMVHNNVSQRMREDIYFCSGFKNNPEQSVFWSLLTPDQNERRTPVESALSLSFSSIQHSSIGLLQSTTGFSYTSLQPNVLDRSLLAMSSPLQQGHCL
jgi:hypothetical protein